MSPVENDTAVWSEIRPHLDTAMDRLSRADREAIILRYFQDASFADVARAFRISENTATQRVRRALARLQQGLLRRDVRLSATALAAVLASNATEAAPPDALAASIAAAGSAAAWASGGATEALQLARETLRAMWIAPAKIAASAAAVLAAGAVVISVILPAPDPGFPLTVERIGTFPLAYMGRTRMPDGNWVFQVNSASSGETHFARVGDRIGSFRIVRCDEQTAPLSARGITTPLIVDASSRIVAKDDQEYVLPRWHGGGKTPTVARIRPHNAATHCLVPSNGTCSAGGDTYLVTGIDAVRNQVRVRRLSDDREQVLEVQGATPREVHP